MSEPAEEKIARLTRERDEMAARVGPRLIPPAAPRFTCKGCPALTTKWWHEVLENDESDSGTTALCSAAGKAITAYWRASDPPPSWCPGTPPAPCDEPSEGSNLKVENKRLHTALEESERKRGEAEEERKAECDRSKKISAAFERYCKSVLNMQDFHRGALDCGIQRDAAARIWSSAQAHRRDRLAFTPTQETSHVES